MNKDIQNIFYCYKVMISIINHFNKTKNDWKDELFMAYMYNRVNGFPSMDLKPLRNVSPLELVKLLSKE